MWFLWLISANAVLHKPHVTTTLVIFPISMVKTVPSLIFLPTLKKQRSEDRRLLTVTRQMVKQAQTPGNMDGRILAESSGEGQVSRQ